jgi:TPR repeat protein
MISDIRALKEAADSGDVSAQYEYGQVCYQNSGVDPYAFEESFHYFLLSAEQGNPDAQFCVGSAYFYGEGVMQSYLEAVKWFRLASEQQQMNALYNLGLCYENGFGVEKDMETALKFYRSAAYYGHEKSKRAVRDIKRKLRGLESWYVRIGRIVLAWLIIIFALSVFRIGISIVFPEE